MIDNYTRSYTETGVSYSLNFGWRNSPGAGFSFPCDEDGTPNWDGYGDRPEALANLRGCLCGEFDVVYEGVIKDEWSWRVPASGRCHCGKYVELARFTNTCDGCGADYNGSGQELAPREQWGEETGEHWTDCI